VRTRFSRRGLAIAVALLGAFALQAIAAARRDSVTIDEFLHLPVGLHALHTGDLRQDPMNSQVPRMLAALPVLASGAEWGPPAGTISWNLGYWFLQANAARYHELFIQARAVIVLLSLLVAVVTARWAFELYGEGAALVALFLFAFSPSLLAHGHLVTLDMSGTLGFLVALYANWRLLGDPSPRRAVWLGVAIGAANLLKLSGIVLFAMMFATWAVRIVAERQRDPGAAGWARLLAIAGLVALLVVNAGYAFDGTLTPLRDATLADGGRLARLAEAAPWLRLPLPRPFVDGVDMVLEVGKDREPSYFLAGELSADGWWYYHLAAFAAKCPLPVLLASIAAIVAWALGHSRGQRDYALFVPVALLFAANTAFNSLYIGERHVLAAYPLPYIAVSPWLADAIEGVWGWRGGGAARTPASKGGLRWVPAVVAVAALAWTAGGTLAVRPRYLQFFNEAAGGPEGGHRLLIDSNIDWGQDLVRLREWMGRNRVDSVALAYFGRVHPSVYGIAFTPLERGVSRGTAVVSASLLMGRPYFWYLGGRLRWVPHETYGWLRSHTPVARVGSMFVFDLP